MAIPKFEDFLFPFMLHLTDGDSNKADMISVLSDYFNLSEEDKTLKTRGGTSLQLHDRVGWSLQWLRRALFVEIPQRGVWRITQRGRDYMSTASDLRESDLMKYPEFAEYSGHNKTRKSSQKHTNSISINESVSKQAKENWLEIVESIKPFLVDGMNLSIYLNAVISCLRILGWKKSNGTIVEETAFNKDNDIKLLYLCSEKKQYDIPVLCISPLFEMSQVSLDNLLAKTMTKDYHQLCIVFGKKIEIYYTNTIDEINPVCVIQSNFEEHDLSGSMICELLNYYSFNLHKTSQYCSKIWSQTHGDNKIKKRIEELSTDVVFVANVLRRTLLSEGYEESLIERVLAKHRFIIETVDNRKHGGAEHLQNESVQSHDTTKYSFDNGKTFLTKRRFVLEVVRRYVYENPEITLDELEAVFPSEIRSKKRGVVRPLSLVKEWLIKQPDLEKRYFMNQSDIIRLHDGTDVVVYNQWGRSFVRFLPIAKKLFGEIKEQPSSKSEVQSNQETSNEMSGIKISAESISKFKNKK